MRSNRGVYGGVLALFVSVTACSGGDDVSPIDDAGEENAVPPHDGGTPRDATSSDAWEENAVPPHDGEAPHDANPPSDVSQPDAADPDAGLADGGPDASPIDAGLDAGPVDAGHDAGPVDAGGADAADASPVDASHDAPPDAAPTSASFYVDPVKGLDTNPGTLAAPFKTIAHAAQVTNALVAVTPPTIHLADGTYDATTQPNLAITFTAPVTVTGSAPGKASIVGLGAAGAEVLVFTEGGSVQNLTFKNTAYGLQADAGTFTASGVAFDAAGQVGPPMVFDGNAVATVDGTGLAAHMTNIPSTATTAACILVQGHAAATWKGVGTITGAPSAPGGPNVPCGLVQSLLEYDLGNPNLTVEGATFQAFGSYAFVVDQAGALTVRSSTIAGTGPAQGDEGAASQGAVWLRGWHANPAPTPGALPSQGLRLDTTSITGSKGSGVVYTAYPVPAVATFTFANSHLDANAGAGASLGNYVATMYLSAYVTATDSTFDSNGAEGLSAWRVTANVTGGSCSKNGTDGLVLDETDGLRSVTVRGAAFAGNKGNGITLSGFSSNPPAIDLGMTASPGGNTFSGISGSASGLAAGTFSVSAVGNTWMPSVQGADANGHYTTATTLTNEAGSNVSVTSGSVVMAE